MRLLLLSSEFPPGPGGIGTHAHQLARHLVQQGGQVKVFASQDYATEDDIGQFNRAQPFTVTTLPSGSSPLRQAAVRWRLVVDCLKQWQPQVMLISGQRMVWLAAVMSRWRSVPVWAAVVHGSEFGGSGWSGRITAWAYRQTPAVICVSRFTQEQMFAAGIHPAITHVIPNGADAEQFQQVDADTRRMIRQRYGINEDAHLLLTTGNLTERKGQDLVIHAMPRILEAFPQTQYFMAGLPTREQAYLELADELSVSEHVRALGRLSPSELVELTNAADLFLMTSRRTAAGDVEGYGIAAVEAALCGVPAVVSAQSGLVEAIEPGVTGRVVPPDSPEETAQAVIDLLANDALRQRMGAAARQRALSQQTWAQVSRVYGDVLTGLAEGR